MRHLIPVLTIVVALGGAARAGGSDPGFDAWGGWRGVATTASGRFRVARVDGVWWLITPDNILARYGSDAAWAAATRGRLADLGINTIGAFSQPELFPATIAYTVRLALSEHAPPVPGVPTPLVARVTRDYFDPAFEAGVVATLPSVAGPCAADPWCIGVFTDNELALGQSLAQVWPYFDAYLLLPPDAPGKRALQAFLETRYGGDVSAFNATWGLALSSFDDLQTLGGC
jgi:hypothetical protein